MILHTSFRIGNSKPTSLWNLKLTFILGSLFILQLVTCPLRGQVMQKRQLTASDYAKWGDLYFDKISADGGWISYRMLYDSGLDTLFVRNTTTLKTYNFPKGTFHYFAGNNHLIYRNGKSQHVINLLTGEDNSYPKNTRIEYAASSNKIIMLLEDDHILQLLNTLTNSAETLRNVTDFAFSPNGKEIAVTVLEDNKYALGMLVLNAKMSIQWIMKDSPFPASNFGWDKNGRALAFLSLSNTDKEDGSLYYYVFKTKKLLHLNPKDNKEFPTDKLFDRALAYPLDISNDLKSVFFGLLPKNIPPKKNKDSVEVWQTDDKWIYPKEQKLGLFDQKAILASWQPYADSIIQITSPEFPMVMLSGNKTCAIISNPKEYEPQFEQEEGPRDFYIIDLKTSKKEIIVKKQSQHFNYLLPSPTGQYIAYFKDNYWWIYDIKTKKHTNIIKNIKASFASKSRLLTVENAYGIAGWSTNDKEILLYDQYDIWAIKPDGTSFRRLTNGREKGLQMRLKQKISSDLLSKNYDGYLSQNIDIDKELILQGKNAHGSTGLYYWSKSTGTKEIAYTDSLIDNIEYLKKQELYIYREQNYQTSPRIILQEMGFEKKVIFQSNMQHSRYEWPTSELLTFHTTKGKNFKGILYYPNFYNPEKKYPMIVHIYEKQSSTFNHYIRPTLNISGGFNPTVMASHGYFVLCPDIEHEAQKVGENAVDFTVSAVKQTISHASVDLKKVGLMGQSFGGYETNFIITQTDLFAAAISGAGISDLYSYYLNVGWDMSISDMTRFINGQWRMEKSLFEAPELYTKNSPITYAENIKTPLLIWAGKADWHVNWNQSIELYMALRRLGKTGTMLLYPEEKHAFLKAINRKEHSKRVLEWFDHYLKNDNSAQWISTEIN